MAILSGIAVGEYWPDSEIRKVHAEIHDPKWYQNHLGVKGDAWDYAYMKRFGFKEIGAARTYETMVFAATTSDDECCPYRISDYHTLDSDEYNDAASAYRGHLAMCEKWSNK